MNVDVYWNAHRKLYSIRDRRASRVIAHLPNVIVENVVFVVSPAGRSRVLREKKKNVHAYVRGEWSEDGRLPPGVWRQATYDPYLNETFIDSGTGLKLASARVVLCRIEDGKAQLYYQPYG